MAAKVLEPSKSKKSQDVQKTIIANIGNGITEPGDAETFMATIFESMNNHEFDETAVQDAIESELRGLGADDEMMQNARSLISEVIFKNLSVLFPSHKAKAPAPATTTKAPVASKAAAGKASAPAKTAPVPASAPVKTAPVPTKKAPVSATKTVAPPATSTPTKKIETKITLKTAPEEEEAETNNDSTTSTPSKKGKEKKPKRLRGWDLFYKEIRETLVEEARQAHTKSKSKEPFYPNYTLIAKSVSERWGQLSDEQKEEYNSQSRDTNASNGIVSKTNKPENQKRPLSPYQYYMKINGHDEEATEATEGSPKEHMKNMAEKWKNLAKAEKDQYAADAEAYNKEHGRVNKSGTSVAKTKNGNEDKSGKKVSPWTVFTMEYTGEKDQRSTTWTAIKGNPSEMALWKKKADAENSRRGIPVQGNDDE